MMKIVFDLANYFWELCTYEWTIFGGFIDAYKDRTLAKTFMYYLFAGSFKKMNSRSKEEPRKLQWKNRDICAPTYLIYFSA